MAVCRQQAECAPRAFCCRHATFPFRVGVVPGSIWALLLDHLLGGEQGNLPVVFLAGLLEKAPVGQNPIALRLQIVIEIVPRQEVEITLDETPDSPIEPHSAIWADDTASVPVRIHHEPMQPICRLQALCPL